MTAVIDERPEVPKAPRKPRRPTYDSLVRKRCRHPESEWELCACDWYYHVTHERKKFRGKISDARSHEEARKKYALIAANIRNGRPPREGFAPVGDGRTNAQAGEEWLSLPRDRKPTTIESYRDHLRAHILPVIGNRLVTEVTSEDLERLVLGVKSTRYRGRELTAKTKKSIARTLHALFEFTIDKGWRPNNPAARLVKALNDPDASPDDVVIDRQDHSKYFDAGEAQQLLQTCHEQFPEWYSFVLTGMQTGMRLGELRGLCYEQINWHGGYITVDQAYVKDRWTTPKNRKPRTVSLSKDLRAALRSRRLYRFDRALGLVEALNGRQMHLVFPSRVGTPLQESRIGAWWEKLIEATGLGYRVRHAMRHTHDSLLIQAGVPVAKIAAESGRSIEETTRTYLHFLPGGNREDAEVLSSLLSPKTHVSSKRELTDAQRPRTATNLRVVSQK